MNGKEPHLHRQTNQKLARLALFGLMVILPVLLAGCASNRETQQNASPTVGGYISVGTAKSF